MSPPRKNDNAPFFIQTRAFQRGVLKLAIDETGGDLEWASAILGISEEFFQIQAERLGGVFPGVPIHEPPLEVGNLIKSVFEEPAPKLEEVQVQEIVQKVVQKTPPALAEQFVEDVIAEPSSSSVISSDNDNDNDDEEVPSGDHNQVETRGRKPAVSSDPNFMTRREVEILLNLSTTGVMRLRSRGELEAIASPELGGALLFPKNKVEEYARTRTELREKRKADQDQS